MHTANEELPEARQPTNLATAAAILDLLLGLLMGALAAWLVADNLGGAYYDRLAVIFTASVATAAVLFVLGGVRLLVRRVAWAARVGEVAVWISVVLIDGSAAYAASTCAEMGCLVVPFAYAAGAIVTVAGIFAWRLNHRAYRRLSGRPGQLES